MAKKRKTVEVARVLELGNRFLASSMGDQAEVARVGVASLLEEILHMTGNYKGYCYLTGENVPYGEKAGVVHDAEGKGKHLFPDATRRVYFTS